MESKERARFSAFVEQQLNPAQKQAVLCEKGMILVRAGAGSGKTRVITARIVYCMLEYGAQPQEIISLTFTNKAAREMQERVAQFMPSVHQLPFVGTFHAYCLQLLKKYSSLISLPSFTVMDSNDRELLLKQIIKRIGAQKRVTPTQIGAAISRYKNDTISVLHRTQPVWGERVYYELFAMYEHERRAARCLDFDDLLVEGLRLVQTQATLREQLHNKVKHILVDEYQDTNRLQNAFLQKLVHREDGTPAVVSLCAVGDEDQSIYSWRGATVDNMLSFPKQFPGALLITIDQNYRSVQPILQTANHIIAHNNNRAPKDIWSSRAAQNRVHCVTVSSSYQEAECVAACVVRFQKTQTLHDIAILYRSHFQSRALEEALIRHSIPYKIVGGTQFYDRLEIKDLLAYLRLAVNPYDRISFARCMNTPPRALGDAVSDLFTSMWEEQPLLSWHEVATLLCANNALPARKQQALQGLQKLIDEIGGAPSPRVAFETLLTRTNFLMYLTESYDANEARERIANVHELGNALAALEQRGVTTLAAFLDEVALLQEHITSEEQGHNFVRLMTLHSAKGLEFHTVILPGLEETVFPSTHASYSPESIEEERRLLYVGVTRAQERLILIYALTRFIYGKTHDQIPSRFIKELPARLVRHIELIGASQWQVNEAIAQIFSDQVEVQQERSKKKASIFV